MNRRKKAFTTIIMVFIVLTIALVGITWYQVRSTTGPSEQEELVEESELTGLENSIYNVQQSLERIITFSGHKSVSTVSQKGGRQFAEYWICKNHTQVPEKDVIIPNIKEQLRREYSQGTDELSRNTPYQIEGISQIETDDIEIKELERFEDIDYSNDRFNVSVDVGDITIRKDGTTRKIEDVVINRTISGNRFWFLYDGLSSFVKENKDYIYRKTVSEIRQVPDTYILEDYHTMYNHKYYLPFALSECWEEGEGPANIQKRHPTKIRRAVESSLDNITRILEKRYFYDQVDCSYSPNRMGDSDSVYPGISITSHDGQPLAPELDKTCTPGELCELFGVPSGFCEWCQFTCSKYPKYLKFRVKTDYHITCEDEEYSRIPSSGPGNMEKLRWEFDISFTARDQYWDQKEYDFEGDNEKGPEAGINVPYTTGPQMLNTCAAPGETVHEDTGGDDEVEVEWCTEGEMSTETDWETEEEIQMETLGKFETDTREVCMFRKETDSDGKIMMNRTYPGTYIHMVKKDSDGNLRFEHTTEGLKTHEKTYEDGRLVQEVISENFQTTRIKYYKTTPEPVMKEKKVIAGNLIKTWKYKENGEVKDGYPTEEEYDEE